LKTFTISIEKLPQLPIRQNTNALQNVLERTTEAYLPVNASNHIERSARSIS